MRTSLRGSFSPSQRPEQGRKNWKAIQLTGNATVAAVASRDEERSRGFIAECQAEAPMDKRSRLITMLFRLRLRGEGNNLPSWR